MVSLVLSDSHLHDIGDGGEEEVGGARLHLEHRVAQVEEVGHLDMELERGRRDNGRVMEMMRRKKEKYLVIMRRL